ncbi:MAG: amidohydrolase family protein [Porticoccaceae bacterium]
MPPISIDLLLHCQWVLPIVPNNQILQDHSVAIDGGRIIEVLPTQDATHKYSSANIEKLSRHILMPGLINTHCHSSTRLMRHIENTIQTQQLSKLESSESVAMSSDPKFISDSINITIAEMIKTGTTCFAEMRSAGEIFIDTARKAGIRSQASFILQEKPTMYGKDAEDYLHRGLKLRDNYANHSLIKVACGLSDISDIEDTTLERLGAYANELDLPIQIQCNESLEAIEACLRKTGHRPLQRLNNNGLLLPETQLINIFHLNSEDRNLLDKTNNHIVICPKQNTALSNYGEQADLLTQTNFNVSLGSSASTASTSLNMMTKVTAAALAINSSQTHHSQSEAAHQALRIATINGAKTLDWDSQIGSIESGKYADLIALEIDSIHHQPLYNPAIQLVYSDTPSPVTHSWVAGQPLLKAGHLCTVDEQKLIQSAKDWGKKLVI